MIDLSYYNELVHELFSREIAVKKHFHPDCSEDSLKEIVINSICNRLNLSDSYVKKILGIVDSTSMTENKILGIPVTDIPNTSFIIPEE